jgi:photosystem II stability/assembly factor-like uncharacterized protein
VQALPGVVSAAMVNRLPLAGGGQTWPIEFEGLDPTNPAKPVEIQVDSRPVTPDYFKTLQIPLIAGRTFTEADDEEAPRVGIIDERLAKRVFGDANPIGRRFHPPMPARVMPDAGWYTIVGVVGHIRHERLDEDGRSQVYWSYKQFAQDRQALVVRTQGDPAALAGSIAAAIRSVDPEQPVYDARTLDAVLDRSVAQRWLQTTILGAFAIIALVLASIGVYGVIAYAVGQRQREFGIRLALGAERGGIVALVVRRGLGLFAAGGALACWQRRPHRVPSEACCTTSPASTFRALRWRRSCFSSCPLRRAAYPRDARPGSIRRWPCARSRCRPATAGPHVLHLIPRYPRRRTWGPPLGGPTPAYNTVHMKFTRFVWATSTAIALAAAYPAFVEGQRRGGGPPADALSFRFLGPVVGNRVASIAGIPGDPYVYYAGAASGGVWKTTDGGIRWTPVSDSMPVAAIGALAVAPSDPNVVWAGTGEAWAIRDSDVIGDGVYKSVDAGKTWTHSGLDETGRIGRILIHPTNSEIVFVCAAGRLTAPQQERGVFRTTDGGQHWDRVLFVDENTGCSGLSMDAKNPRVIFAGTWQVEMHPWAEISGGAGSGVFVSRDGGTTWTRIEGAGLPRSPLGKIDVAVAPSDSNRVYALIQTKDQGSVWRSDDGGASWRVVNWQRALIGRAGYYIHIRVSPANEDEVFVSNSSFWQSTDGGRSFEERFWGGDNHDIWWDPKDADRFVITHDAGLTITTQHARSTQRVTLPIGQMYHVAVDNQIPYYVYSNMQDDGTMRGSVIAPENAGAGYNGSGNTWDHGLGGCESGHTVPDPADPNIVWSTCYGNKVTRYDHRLKVARSVAPGMITLDAPPTESKYRCHWSAPLAIDWFDHNNVYYGCNVIFHTSNGGQSWRHQPGSLDAGRQQDHAVGRHRRRQPGTVRA